MPKIEIDTKFKKKIYNKISPKILSENRNKRIFFKNKLYCGRIICTLRILNKLSLENMCLKLNISKEDYLKIESNKVLPNQEISNKLMDIFDLKIENHLL